MNIILLAPHQDDEILGAYLYILRLKAENHHISVVFSTNGDYYGKEIAKRRYYESVGALLTCGITENDIYYMGYGDTGMQLYHSFLYRLYYGDAKKGQASRNSEYTYHPASGLTVHKLFHNNEARYCKHNFLCDLREIIKYISPDIIIMPSIYDLHGDHHGLALFAMDVIKCFHNITVYTYLIHGGSDKIWPPRGKNPWVKPNSVPLNIWNNRFIIRGDSHSVLMKSNAISKFESQLKDDNDGFLMSFAKNDEIFFKLSLP